MNLPFVNPSNFRYLITLMKYHCNKMCTLNVRLTGSDEGNQFAGEPLVPVVVISCFDQPRALSTRCSNLSEVALLLLSELSALVRAVSLK